MWLYLFDAKQMATDSSVVKFLNTVKPKPWNTSVFIEPSDKSLLEEFKHQTIYEY